MAVACRLTARDRGEQRADAARQAPGRRVWERVVLHLSLAESAVRLKHRLQANRAPGEALHKR